MRCQKGKRCVKQPSNELPFSTCDKICTGCNRTGHEAKDWWFYVVRCRKGALYCGISPDVEARVAKHNAGKGAKSVKALGLPVKLAYKLRMGSMSDAMAFERAVKKLSKRAKEFMVFNG